MLESSTGMCAGNTKKEAIIQGLSEQFEHQIKYNFIDLIKNQKIYQLNLNYIKNQQLQQIIQNIQTENDFFVFDASYYYNTPVLFGLIINKKTKSITINIASFPVFNIAFERICTELYQGVKSYTNNKKDIIFPSKVKENIQEDYFWRESSGSFYRISSLPEELFIKQKQICNSPNLEIFLTDDKQYTEEELYDYYLKLCYNNNYNFYYYDCSLSKDMYAIKIYSEEIINIPKIYLNPISTEAKNCLINSHLFFNEFFFNNIMNEELRNNFIISYNNLNDIEKIYFDRYRGRTYGYQIFNLYPAPKFNLIVEIYCNKNFYLNDNFINSITDPLIAKSYREYSIKLRYLNSKEYTLEEIQSIMNYLNIEITEEDYKYYQDSNYLLDKIVFDNIYKLYHSDIFLDYINLLVSLKYVNV